MRSDIHVHLPERVTINVNVAINGGSDSAEVRATLARIEQRLGIINEGVQEMALDFTAMEAEVAENTDAVAAASSLLTTLADEIRVNAGNPAALQALADSLDANNQNLVAAVVANTPAAPEPPVEPEV